MNSEWWVNNSFPYAQRDCNKILQEKKNVCICKGKRLQGLMRPLQKKKLLCVDTLATNTHTHTAWCGKDFLLFLRFLWRILGSRIYGSRNMKLFALCIVCLRVCEWINVFNEKFDRKNVDGNKNFSNKRSILH